jgi:lycopene beta-cyclase
MNQTYVSLIKSDINEFDSCYVATETDSYTCDTIFNSIYRKAEVENQTKFPLQQHFIGWFIKVKNLFSTEQATFMDFSVEQKAIPALCMFCPSKTEALLNIRCSQQLLEKSEYEQEIQNYIQTRH